MQFIQMSLFLRIHGICKLTRKTKFSEMCYHPRHLAKLREISTSLFTFHSNFNSRNLETVCAEILISLAKYRKSKTMPCRRNWISFEFFFAQIQMSLNFVRGFYLKLCFDGNAFSTRKTADGNTRRPSLWIQAFSKASEVSWHVREYCNWLTQWIKIKESELLKAGNLISGK